LQRLEQLNMGQTWLEGTFPAGIGDLKQLRELNLEATGCGFEIMRACGSCNCKSGWIKQGAAECTKQQEKQHVHAITSHSICCLG
jgi:hypothetical protein